MLQQNLDAAPSSNRQPSKPDLDQGQEVRILRGQYRGTVGHVSRTEWNEASGEWLYEVSDSRVYLGQFRSKELW